MKGTISIYRFVVGTEHKIGIDIEDSGSNTGFLNIRMDLDDFARAVTGQSYIDCDFELRGLEKVGTKHKHKREYIHAEHRRFSDEEAKSIVAPYEINGWVARLSNLNNPHFWEKLNGKPVISVIFERYVSSDTLLETKEETDE